MKEENESATLLDSYYRTAENALPESITLSIIRQAGHAAMIDSDGGLWINEKCMGRFDSVLAQKTVLALSHETSTNSSLLKNQEPIK